MSKSITSQISTTGLELLQERARDVQREFGKNQGYNVIGFIYGKEPEMSERNDPYYVFAITRENSEADVDDFDQRLTARLMKKGIEIIGGAGYYNLHNKSIDGKIISEGYVSVPSLDKLRRDKLSVDAFGRNSEGFIRIKPADM